MFRRLSACGISHGNRGLVPPISEWGFVATVQAIEASTIILASLLALEFARQRATVVAPSLALCLCAALLLTVIVHCVFRSLSAYSFDLLLRPGASALVAFIVWCIATGPLVVFSTLHDPQGDYARAWVLGWFASVMGLIPGLRLLSAVVGLRCRQAGILGRSVCIVGTREEAEACIRQLRAAEGIVVLGLFSDNFLESGNGRENVAVPWLGTLAEVPLFLHSRRVDEMIVAASPADNARMRAIIQQLSRLPVRVLVSWGIADTAWPLLGQEVRAPRLGDILLLPVVGKPLDGWLWVVKDVQDRLLALVALIAFAPLMVLIALAIVLSSPGPVFFRQVRQGYNGREFRIWKFRTMHVEATADAGSLTLTRRDDPRLFAMGAFLRRSSLDELPQLLNVLSGDMWLIGPRPHSPRASAANRLYSDAVVEYPSRHRIKPGMTGWAQVNGWRGPTETLEQIEQRVGHDLYYIDHWSILLDARILCRTILHGFAHRNAF